MNLRTAIFNVLYILHQIYHFKITLLFSAATRAAIPHAADAAV